MPTQAQRNHASEPEHALVKNSKNAFYSAQKRWPGYASLSIRNLDKNLSEEQLWQSVKEKNQELGLPSQVLVRRWSNGRVYAHAQYMDETEMETAVVHLHGFRIGAREIWTYRGSGNIIVSRRADGQAIHPNPVVQCLVSEEHESHIEKVRTDFDGSGGHDIIDCKPGVVVEFRTVALGSRFWRALKRNAVHEGHDRYRSGEYLFWRV